MVVSSRELLVSTICSAIVGAVFMLTWTVVRKPLRHIYLKRVVRPAAAACAAGVPHLLAAAARAATVQPSLIIAHAPCALYAPDPQQITDLPIRPAPPPLMASLMARCFGYLAPVFLVTDMELMQTAGLDALVRQAGAARVLSRRPMHPEFHIAARRGWIHAHTLCQCTAAVPLCQHGPPSLCALDAGVLRYE